ncbi:protein gurken [Drosophila novamexicana]|uniref:protein gurken n=1 Tax=Drosophila novamexicana TaxID=47314 RepID=UPI0011E5D850|nr:protein gurken [Drosophila novamexicana]
MQIQCMPILKVIFVLSTIVAVTDCCASRILLLRQQTLQIEEHVVQLVSRMELQQALNLDGQLSEPDTFGNTAQMPQESLDLAIHGELASIATTEQDTSTEPWSSEVETTTTTNSTTTRTTATTTRTIAKSTIKTATGEPPPNDSTVQLARDAAISELNEALMTTTATLTPTTPITTNGTGNRTLSKEFNFRIPCSEEYLKYFCLNGGNCFRWESSSGFSYCECANGYGGERCDSKTESGVYVPFRPRKRLLKTAHVVFSFPMLILLSTVYVLFGAVYMLRNVSAQRRKQQQLHLHKQRFFVSC